MLHDKKSLVAAALEEIGRAYVLDMRKRDDPERMSSDWIDALRFTLGRIYFQGRRDALSFKYFSSAFDRLKVKFEGAPESILRDMVQTGEIPARANLRGWDRTTSQLWRTFDSSMGRGRDLEMVIDLLGYLGRLQTPNLVLHSVSEIRAGRLWQHRIELQTLRQIGPKISAFYLRDVVLLYGLNIPADQAAEIQPIDRWVQRLRGGIEGICGSPPIALDDEEWVVQFRLGFPRSNPSGATCNHGSSGRLPIIIR